MKHRIETLMALTDRFSNEIELIVQDLPKENLSPTSKETIIEETALMNGFLRKMRESISLTENLCCDTRNLNLSDMEDRYFKQALEKHSGHIEKSAKWLGISTRTMSRRIDKLKINVSSYKKNRKNILAENMTKNDTLTHMVA
jgi:transcriptional regulator with PAS, ATPase and Fis domain